jgi:acyl-coenzyme A thioesterase PaaI-like protein
VKRAGGSRGSSFAPELRIASFWDAATSKVVGVAFFPRSVEGPQNAAHGGSIATVLDNILGTLSLRVLGFGAYTLQLNVSYKRFVRPMLQLNCPSQKVRAKKVRYNWQRPQV